MTQESTALNQQDPAAILVDLDGTLALRGSRSPYDWASVSSDTVNEPVMEIVKLLADASYTIIVVSGRDEVCRDDSVQWLDEHLGKQYLLLMRSRGDNRRDELVKAEFWQWITAQGFQVKLALDDRNRCVDLWRAFGVTTLQVAPGDF